MSTKARSLAVQVVLYDDALDALRRLAEGVRTTLDRARAAGCIDRATLRFGDSSERPCLDPAGVDGLRATFDGVAQVSYRHFGENLGSGGGSNALAADGSDDVIWVLNPDTYPSPDAATHLLRSVVDAAVGAVDARQLPIEHPKAYDPVTGDCEWVSGASMMIRRTVFDAVHGFDAHFFPLYCDDVDLSWRLRLAGYRTVHVPDATVFHDKTIDPSGRVEMSEHAVYSSGLARLFLARRYGAADVERQFLDWTDAHGTDAHRRAASEFRRRLAAGDVPDELPGATGVAAFVGNDYGHHRFTYDVTT